MKRVFFKTGVVLLLCGVILFGVVMVASGFDYKKLSDTEFVTNTYEIDEAFDKISIDATTAKLTFVPAEDKDCKVVCYETEKEKHAVAVQDKTLTIKAESDKEWFDFIDFSVGTPEVTLYLPQSEFKSLVIDTDTGDITIPEDFSFGSFEIKGDTADVSSKASVSDGILIKLSTGDVRAESISAGAAEITTSTGDVEIISADVEGNVKIKTDTGHIELKGVTCKDFEAESDTGKMALTDVTCRDLSADSDTGKMTLTNVTASGSFRIENGTGDVEFDNSDAEEIYVKTSTGDVTGTFASEKVFITETGTGKTDVPKTVSGGRCEITTGTGDIRIGEN